MNYYYNLDLKCKPLNDTCLNKANNEANNIANNLQSITAITLLISSSINNFNQIKL